MRDGVLAVDPLGGFFSLENKLLETIVRGAPRVLPGLAGAYAASETIKIAAAEAPDGGGSLMAGSRPSVERGFKVREGLPRETCGHDDHGKLKEGEKPVTCT